MMRSASWCVAVVGAVVDVETEGVDGAIDGVESAEGVETVGA